MNDPTTAADIRLRRRLDRILAEDYLAGLPARSTGEIRRMRHACQEEETEVSFVRRCLQGKLDIIRSEAQRRRDAPNSSGTVHPLLGVLPSILGDAHTARRPLRFRVTRPVAPRSLNHHRREFERFANQPVFSQPAERSADELIELAEAIAAHERELSTLRSDLHARIDALQNELASRYINGQTTISEVLNSPR